MKILFIGDSLTEGYGVAKENAYPALVEKKLNSFEKEVATKNGKSPRNFTVVNAGAGGSTSASAERALKWSLRGQPNLVFLALGANDGLRGLTIEQTTQNLKKAIKLAQSKNAEVILGGMKLPINYGKKYRKKFEEMYDSLAKDFQLKMIPFLLEGVGGEATLNQSDGIHPNEKGHEVIAGLVFEFLKKEFMNQNKGLKK